MTETNIPKSEIDELIATIREYKVFIALVTLLIFSISIFYAFFTDQKTIYRGVTLFQIGKKNTHLVEGTDIVKKKIEAEYNLSTPFNTNHSLPRLVVVQSYSENKGIIKLKADAYTIEDLNITLTKVFESIEAEHHILIDDYNKTQNIHKTRLENNIKNKNILIKQLKVSIKNSEKKLQTLEGDPNSIPFQNTLMIKIIKDDASIVRAKDDKDIYAKSLRGVKTTLKGNRTFHTHILIDKVAVGVLSAAPKKSIILAMGLVGGLVFSILLAFFLSFLRKES